MIHVKWKILTFSLLNHWKMAFPYLNEKLALLEKTSKWNQLFLKKYQKLFISLIFFFVSAPCAAILSSNWKKKNNNTISTISKIQTMKILNNPTTTSLAVLFLTVVRFNLLEWQHSHGNKETFCPFLFL